MSEETAKQASECGACEGCTYRNLEAAGWCYMFRERPESLPCPQHDKYKDQRAATGSLVRKNPHILALMIMGMSR